MLIIIFLTLVHIAISDTHIGIYQYNIKQNLNISYNNLSPFRFHYVNNRTNSSDWKQQSDGISIILSPKSSKSHNNIWKFLIKLFDNTPQDSLNYNIELSECPKPLYINKLNIINQCQSSNQQNSKTIDIRNGIKYKDIIKYELTDNDGNSTKFGVQKSCFHDYTLQPWISYSEFNNSNYSDYLALILIPKLYEIRYNFNKRIVKFINNEIDNISIIDLYWYNMQFDGNSIKITFLSKFSTKNNKILNKFAFVSNNLDIINKYNLIDNTGHIHQSISGVGSHRVLNVKISHNSPNRIFKIIHYLDKSFFIDPAEISNINSFNHIKCTRNTNKQYDYIKLTKNKIETTFNQSSVQIIEILICPPNNLIEYSLPIHARYMPTCKVPSCTGYEYSLITIPNVYYSTDINGDFALFDDIELAKLLQFTYSISFINYINNFINVNTNEDYYWVKLNTVKDSLSISNLDINLPSRMSCCIVEFIQDRGKIYTTSTLTRGLESDYLKSITITILTTFILTIITIYLILLGNGNSNFMDKISITNLIIKKFPIKKI